MTRKPVFANPDDSLKDCSQKMLKAKVGALIIKENGNLLGIITEKDIVHRVVAKGLDLNEVKVKNVMTKDLSCIHPEKDIYDAMLQMSRDVVRRLPVVENNKLIGLLTEKDILKIQPELFEMCLNRFDIREGSFKPIKDLDEGVCEKCGSSGEVFIIRKRKLCAACK